MQLFQNLDLLSVGIVISSIVILGITVLLSNIKSSTNRSFFFLAVFTAFWSSFNYLTYQSTFIIDSLWMIKFALFFAVWHAYFFFRFAYIFPRESISESKTTYALLLFAVFSSLVTLTPYVISRVLEFSSVGQIIKVEYGFGIIFFGLAILGSLFSGLFFTFKKAFSVIEDEKKQSRAILVGATATFTLIVIFNFIFPVFLNNTAFIKFGALFMFPFIALTFYSIYKHKLFNIKIIATVILAFFVTIFSFTNIIFADNASQVALNVTAFIIILLGSIRLINDMLKMEEANEEKAEFMSFASHELRSPLTVIKGYSSMLLDGSFGEISPDVRDSAQKILMKANVAISLIGQYLNKSKVELNQLTYNFGVFDFGDLTRSVANEYHHNAEQANIKLFYMTDNKAPYFTNGDEGKLREVVANILDNSIKYTPEGSVNIFLSRDQDKILLKISDTGLGMSAESKEMLFKKFSRLRSAEKAKILGTGLGLYLAHTFIKAHNGRIWAESEGEGMGSTFYLELNYYKEEKV